MKLSEARTTASHRVYWIRGLDFNDILEHTYVPFVEPVTKAIIIAADANYEGSYFNMHTIPYDEMKHELEWAIEVLASKAQLNQLLDLYWPEVGGDQVVRSTVWDDASLERVIDAAQDKIPAKELHNLGEQVTRILEAQYHRQPSANEVYIKYALLSNEGDKHYDNIVVLDHDGYHNDPEYDDYNNDCVAMLYLWVMDSTINQAKKDIAEFMRVQNLPYTDISIDMDNSFPDFKYGKIRLVVLYEGSCRNWNKNNLHEARTHAGPSARKNIVRHQVYNAYKEHETSTGTRPDPNIQVRQHETQRSWSTESQIYPTIHFWFQTSSKHLEGVKWPESKRKAEQFAKDYMRKNNLPYTSVRAASKFGASLIHVQFRFGETEDLKEARHHNQKDVEECPECHGKGGMKYPYQGEMEWDSCWTCDGAKVVPKKKKKLKEARHHSQKNKDAIYDVVSTIRHSYPDSVYDSDGHGDPRERLYDLVDRIAVELGYTFDDWDTEKAVQLVYDRFFGVKEARYHNDQFSIELQKTIKAAKGDSPGRNIGSASFDTDHDYFKTTNRLSHLLGEPDWETYDYGDDVPFWLIEDETIYVSIEKQARPIGASFKFVTEVIVEHHPDGFGNNS